MSKAIYSKEQEFIVNQLKKARLEANLSQLKVSQLLHKTQSHVSKIEAGQRRIDIVTLKDFAKIYKKDITYFIK